MATVSTIITIEPEPEGIEENVTVSVKQQLIFLTSFLILSLYLFINTVHIIYIIIYIMVPQLVYPSEKSPGDLLYGLKRTFRGGGGEMNDIVVSDIFKFEYVQAMTPNIFKFKYVRAMTLVIMIPYRNTS